MAKTRRERGEELSAADLQRLQEAVGRSDVDLTRSVHGPGSVTWRVNREVALLAGGGCALMLQVAHPLVAAGVARYSNFKQDPLQRLYRTLDLVLTITFCDAVQAIHAVREIERRHARVHGTLSEGIGPFPRGTVYDANDPELLLWVHATLVDTGLRAYEMFIETLSDEDRATYYEESKITGRLFGIPETLLPPTWSKFEKYMRTMTQGNQLAVSPAAQDIAASILQPAAPFGLRDLLPPLNLLTLGLLPPELRELYGYTWSGTCETLMRAEVTATRLLIPWLPGAVRFFPHARRAASSEGLRRPAGVGELRSEGVRA